MVVTTLISQLLIAVPIILFATQAITAAFNGIFTINNGTWRHVISWIVAILVSLGYYATGYLQFGLPEVWQNYVFAGVSGIFAGAAANGLYDWDKMKAFFTLIENLFRPAPEKKVVKKVK